MSTISIPTTQNIELEYPVATIGDRVAATLIDFFLQFAYLFLWGTLSDLAEFEFGIEGWVIILIPFMFYHLFCEIAYNGQSIGKRIMKTQVVSVDGVPPTIAQYVLRWLLRSIDVWIFNGLVSIIAISVSKQSQRLGDLAAGTTVVKLKLITTFGDTIFVDTEEDHVLSFPQVELLTDRDLSILKDVLEAGKKNANSELIFKLAAKIKEVMGVSSDLPDITFLQKVMEDYNYLYGRK